jgi:hypothetical protein
MDNLHDTTTMLRELRELLHFGACNEQDATVAADIIARNPETFEHMGTTDAVDMVLDMARVRLPRQT